MDISIVIPTYNNCEPIRRVLAALSQQTYPREKYEVVVVEDGSTQPVEDLIVFWKNYFNLKYCRTKTRNGISRARNIGIDRASGRVVVFLDSDMIVTPDFVSEHSKMHQNGESVGVGYRVRLSRRVPPVSIGDIIHNFQLIKQLPCSQDEREDIYQICDSQINDLAAPWICVYGCNFSVLYKNVIDVGKFDEQFQINWGGEDIEFAYRLYKKGLKFTLNRKACGYHIFHHANWTKNLRSFDENLFLFLKKYPELEVELYKDNTDISVVEYVRLLPTYTKQFQLETRNDYFQALNPAVLQWLKTEASGRKIMLGCTNDGVPTELGVAVACAPSNAQAKQWDKIHPKIKWMNLLGSSLPYDKASFDTIILTDFIQYLPKNKCKQIIRESIRVAKRLIFCHHTQTTSKPSLRYRDKHWSINYETLSEICDLLPSEHYKVTVKQIKSLLTLTIEPICDSTGLTNPSSLRVHVNITTQMSPEFRYYLRELAIALHHIGVDVSCEPIYAGDERTIFPQREQQILNSLEEKNMDYVRREYVQFPGYHFFIGRQKIGCLDIACEFNHAFDMSKTYLSSDDVFWCLSSHSLNEYLKMGGNPKSTEKITFGINPELFAPTIPPKKFRTQKGFIFLYTGLPTQGDGLNLLIAAFVEEFSVYDDVCLVLKFPCHDDNFYSERSIDTWLYQWRRPLDIANTSDRNLDLWVNDLVGEKGNMPPEILIIQENEKDVTNVASYYTGCDCFVKPMYTSGFDSSIIEAMACGKPVITTGYGSVLDYCNQENSYLIDHQVTPMVMDKQGNMDLIFLRWSEPDKGTLKHRMRYVYENRQEARQVGLSAAEQIRSNHTWNKTAQKFVKFLLNTSSNSELQDLSDDLTDLTPRNLYHSTQI